MKEDIKSFYSVSFQQASKEKYFVILKNQVWKVLIIIKEAQKLLFISKGRHNEDVNENSAFCSYFTHLNSL